MTQERDITTQQRHRRLRWFDYAGMTFAVMLIAYVFMSFADHHTLADWPLLVSGIVITVGFFFCIGASLRYRHHTLQDLEDLGWQSVNLFDSADEAFIAFEQDGLISYWSAQATALFGWSPDEAIGRNFIDVIIPEEDRAMRHEIMAAADSMQERNVNRRLEFRAVHKDGHFITVETTWWRSRSDSKISFRALMHDVSARRAAADALETARLAALDSVRVKSEFLANMSHEIRTPMNGMIGLTDVLSMTELDEHQLELVDTIRQSSEHLLQVINRILDFSKLESGQLRLETIDFDVHSLLQQVHEEAQTALIGKDVDCALVVSDTVPLVLKGDAGRIKQILQALTDNAVKFTNAGHINVLCTAEPVGSRVQLRIEVQDTGIGIALDDQAVMFESFRQADGSMSRQYEGSGLGLTIARQLSQLMDGQVAMTSHLGEGSTFWFTVTLDHAASTPTQPDV